MRQALQPLFRVSTGLCAATILLAIVAYRNALPNPFVYDDHVVIVENASIRQWSDVPAILLHDVKRPLVNLTYAADYAMWGLTPWGYHLTNLLLHLLNVALLFAFARRATDDHDRLGASRMHEGRSLAVAFMTAALLAVHPLMTQAVGYVSARADLLCGTFVLLALLSYRAFVVSGRTRWLVACIATWLVAVGAKETAVPLPLLLALYDGLVLRVHGERWRRRLVGLHLPLVALMTGIGLVRLGVLLGVEHAGAGRVHWTHALVEAEVLRHYLSLLVVPVGQSVFHPIAAITSLRDPRGMFALAWVIALVVIAVRVGLRDRLAATGLVWFVLLLAPSAVLVMFDLGEPMAEHRVYLASIGVFVTAGCAAGSLWAFARRGSIVWRAGLAVASVVLLGTLTSLTVARNRVWSDPVRLWSQATAHAPDIWVTHLMLGQELQLEGRCVEALDAYDHAIALRPQEPFAYLKSGVCLAALGRLDEATGMFDRARVLQPQSPRPLVGLGVVASLAGRSAEARRWFVQAVHLAPADAAARDALDRFDTGAVPATCAALTGDARQACLGGIAPAQPPP